VARPVITFSDDEMRAMMSVAQVADRDALPAANAGFLDAFIVGVARCTGRVYGQTTYERLLAAFQIRRRPSAQTWSKAIQRAHTNGVALSGPTAGAASTGGLLPGGQRSPPEFPSTPTLTAAASAALAMANDELVELRSRVQVAEYALRDAYSRLSKAEAERQAALERAVSAEVGLRTASEQILTERQAHSVQVNAMTEKLSLFSNAVDRLTGLERHLKLQTDTLRQEMGQQRDAYKARAEAAEKALGVERAQSDAMRRLLGNRTRNLADGHSDGMTPVHQSSSSTG
jgi:hypothetical protein